ncbi:MAG: hypothetical protein IJ515_05630 [Clostridia bacterium]|nr:hypothetical protein [Clostridia bacterium]
MQKNKLPLFEIAAMIIGELLVSLIIIGVYLIIGKGSVHYSVITGAALGSVVTVLNFLFLAISTNRAVDKVMAERGDGEMDEEEAAEFAAKHQSSIQAAAKISYVIRTLTMVATLVLAFLLDNAFDLIATLIPLLMLRPILMISQLIGKRNKSERGNKV